MLTDPEFVILAAGKGSRLGREAPKPLTVLSDGRTILQQQLDNIEAAFGASALKRVQVVVGYKAEQIADALPRSIKLTHNEEYDSSNTAVSLLKGISHTKANRPVIWMNGDVVFSPLILGCASNFGTGSFMAVVPGACSDEEMKYSLSDEGLITKVSKENKAGVGEAVGINQISAESRGLFQWTLKKQPREAYFEAAIQKTIELGVAWHPLDTSGLLAMEVDFAEDLERVNTLVSANSF